MKKQNLFLSHLHLSSYLCPLIFGVAVSSFAAEDIDSDGDGLTDLIELARGLDPHSVDSDMNGLSDFDEFNRTFDIPNYLFSSVSAVAVPNSIDADQDGLNDFLETYGYYIVDNQAASAPRRMSIEEWNTIKNNPLTENGVAVFNTALSKLESDSRAYADPADSNFVLLELDGAKNAIIDAYIDAGLSPTNKMIEGLVNHPGSAANILNKLMEQALLYPKDLQGNALTVYFTHPLKVSTDHDPFTDYDEARGIFPAGRPLSPADHPLIAAAPYIKATLESFEVIDVEKNSLTLGEQDTELKGKVVSKTRSHSHGVSVAIKTENEWGVKPGIKLSAEIKQDNSWGFSSGTNIEERNTHATYTQNGTATQSNCFAKLVLNLAVENMGYANASDISFTFNIYLGDTDTPWGTIPVGPNEIGNLLLIPGQRESISELRSGEESCLTMDETNYLARGGQVSIETIVADAKVDFYNQSSNLVEQGGSWQVYNNLIQQDLALLNIDVNATNGKQVNHSIYYSAANNDYPHLSLSVEQALQTAFTAQTCDVTLNPNTRCFVTDTGDQIELGANTYVDIMFFDNQGVSVSNFDMHEKYFQLSPNDSEDPFDKIFPSRSSVTIVNNDFEIPQFTHIEAINLVRQDEASQPDMVLHTAVSDFFGIQDVFFCHSDNNCLPMEKVFGDPEVSEHSGQYTITLPNYAFTGVEFVKAINVIGNESPNQTPLALFLLMHDSLAALVADYADHIATLQNRVDALSSLQTQSPAEYAALIEQGLLSSTGDAQELLDELKGALDEANSACTLDVDALSQDLSTNIQNLRQACLAQYQALEQALEDTPIKAFDINKLPGQYFHERYLGRTKAGKDRGLADFSSNNARDCVLDSNQFSVGIGMHKLNDKGTPVDIHLYYVQYDPVTNTLSDIQKKICGDAESVEESKNILSVDQSSLEAELILDVSLRLDDNIRPVGRKKSRWVENLCVSYRTFNFGTGQWLGDVKIKCNDQQKNDFGSFEGSSDLLDQNNQSLTLKGLTVFHRETGDSSAVMEVFGYHSELYRTHFAENFETLSEFHDYKIFNVETGELLTITSKSASSAAIGLEHDSGSESQTWKVERINDREMRLVPKVYDDGVFVRNPGSAPSIAKLAGEDATSHNYLQHLQISKVNGFGESPYQIRSVVDGGVLTIGNDHSLVWKNNTGIASPITESQQWEFVPVIDEELLSDAQEQVLTVTNKQQSSDLLGNCEVFDLGGEYFIKKVTINGKQSIYNKSVRLVSFNNTDSYRKTVFPTSNPNFSFTHTLPGMTTKSARVQVCNTFFAQPLRDNFIENNRVNDISVTVIPADG